MINNTRIFLFCTLFLFGSCSSKEKEDDNKNESHSLNNPGQSESISTLKMKVITDGDTSSYKTIFNWYLNEDNFQEFLSYALIMANKYDYPQAYYDVYDMSRHIYLFDIQDSDSLTAKMAIEYLLLAGKKGHHQALEQIERYNLNQSDDYLTQFRKMHSK